MLDKSTDNVQLLTNNCPGTDRGYILDIYWSKIGGAIALMVYSVIQGPPLNRELVNGSHLLIVQNLPRPKWTLM